MSCICITSLSLEAQPTINSFSGAASQGPQLLSKSVEKIYQDKNTLTVFMQTMVELIV